MGFMRTRNEGNKKYTNTLEKLQRNRKFGRDLDARILLKCITELRNMK
jgi:hypothetical protein